MGRVIYNEFWDELAKDFAAMRLLIVIYFTLIFSYPLTI